MKITHDRLDIVCGKAHLEADLLIPERAHGIVLVPFPMGGGQRLGARDAYLANALRAAGFATLLANLLTHGEDRLATLRYNVKVLTQRIVALTHWAREQPRLLGMPVGYVASGATAAAALRAADRLGEIVRAVVIRSGRPDLAGADPLGGIQSATLIIAGERDEDLHAPNRQAYERMNCRREMLLVPRAGHFFDEPGTLDHATRHATRWMSRWLVHAGGESANRAEAAAGERPAEADAAADTGGEAAADAQSLQRADQAAG